VSVAVRDRSSGLRVRIRDFWLLNSECRQHVVMTNNRADLDAFTWDPALDAVIAAPKHHKVLFENERLRVLEIISV
jgi:hypothetical protein